MIFKIQNNKKILRGTKKQHCMNYYERQSLYLSKYYLKQKFYQVDVFARRQAIT